MPPRRNAHLALFSLVALCILFLRNTRTLLFPPSSELQTSPPPSPPPPLQVTKPIQQRPFLSPTSHVRPIRPTGLLLRPHGFTVSDNLYVRNGTMYAVVEDPSTWPDLRNVLAKGLSPNLEADFDPTDKEMRVITPSEARLVLGDEALVIDGMTFILYDNTQFMDHFYHWWGEIILGAMRVYSALTLLSNVSLPLPEPRRFIIPNIADHEWRDRAGLDGPMMRAAFPSTAISRGDYWNDLASLERTFVFERAMIVSRKAAHKHPLGSEWAKMISSTMPVKVPLHFWEPLRQRFVMNFLAHLPSSSVDDALGRGHEALGINDAWLDPVDDMATSKRGVRRDPDVQQNKRQNTALDPSIPLVLYVSRQNGGRRLTDVDNASLVKALQTLCAQPAPGPGQRKFCYFIEAHMEQWSIRDQIDAAARATIMVGVHGNGLTHQLWMPPSDRSTVVEIFYPETYLHDYEMLARNMGHKHYAVWNDTLLTYPEGEWFHGAQGGKNEDFNGHAIPVHGATVAEVIRKRLTGEE